MKIVVHRGIVAELRVALSMIGVISVVFGPGPAANAQTILEDPKGGDLIVGYLDGIFRANVADASLSMAYSANIDYTTFDFSAKGKSTDGIAPLVSLGQLTPSTTLTIGSSYNFSKSHNRMAVAAIQEKYEVLREKAEDREAKEEATKKTQAEKDAVVAKYKEILDKINEQETTAVSNIDPGTQLKIGLRGGYTAAQYQLFNAKLAFAQQLSKLKFEAGSAQLFATSFFPKLNSLLTLVVSYERNNNISDLPQLNVTSSQDHKDSTGTQDHLVKKDVNAWSGDYVTFASAEVNSLCSSLTATQLLDLATKQMYIDNPMGFPMPAPGTCRTDWRVSHAACWSWMFDNYEFGQVAPCDYSVCCLTLYQICKTVSGALVVTQLTRTSTGPTCMAHPDQPWSCEFICN